MARKKKFKGEVKHKLTMQQAQSMIHDNMKGLCVDCGEVCSDCEPDARERQCPSCHLFTVFGFEECVQRGWIDDGPDDEADADDVRPLRDSTSDVFRGPTGHGKTLSVDAVLDSHFGRSEDYDPLSTKPADKVRCVVDWFRNQGWILWRTGFIAGKRVSQAAINKFLLIEPDATPVMNQVLKNTGATGKLTFVPSRQRVKAILDSVQHQRNMPCGMIDTVRLHLQTNKPTHRDVDAELWYFTLAQTGRPPETLQYYCNPHEYSVRIYAPAPDGSLLLVAVVMSLE